MKGARNDGHRKWIKRSVIEMFQKMYKLAKTCISCRGFIIFSGIALVSRESLIPEVKTQNEIIERKIPANPK